MDTNAIIEVLAGTDPFELLDPATLKELAEQVSIQEYTPNTYVFKQDEPSLDCLFVIVAGMVEITVTNDRGLEMVVGIRRARDFFGETVVLSQQRYPAGARVKEALTCCLVKRVLLEKLIYSIPEFSGFFNALLSERMRLLYTEIVSEQSADTQCGIDAPLFKKRVSEAMSAPVLTCHLNDRVTDAARTMTQKNISAIVVVDDHKTPRGILTEKILVAHLISAQRYPLETCQARQIMNSRIEQITPEAFLGQALVSMIRNKTKTLIVSSRGELAGIISMVDLLKSRSTGSLLLTQDIESHSDLDHLAQIGPQIDNVLNALVTEKAGVNVIFDVMSELLERLTRRVIELAEERMKREGLGAPPVEYCWINMGSAARYEQTLRTDQDNAMIYQDPEPGQEESVEAYFKQLAEYIVEGLMVCGFAECSGGVMATNAMWRRSLSKWKAAIAEWVRSYDPADTRTLTILLDFRPVWGNMVLAKEFWKAIFEAFNTSQAAQHMLTKDALQYKLPITFYRNIKFLGSFITEKSGPHKNQLDLKKSGAVHIVNGMRIFAVKNEIEDPSTFGRIRLLAEKGALSRDDADYFAASFETLMIFRIRESVKKVKQGAEPDNFIDPYSLTQRETMLLKDAFAGVAHLQKMVDKEFSVVWLKPYI